MAAVIQIHSPHLPDASADLVPARADRPELRLVEGGRSARSRRMRRVYVVRRLSVLAVATVVLIVVASLGSALLGGTDADAASSSPARTHVVRPGDTLWAIAHSVDATADPRDVVEQIVALNATGATGSDLSAGLVPGQVVRVPAAG